MKNKSVIRFLVILTFTVTMMSSFAQGTLTVKAIVEGYYYPIITKMIAIIDPINEPQLFDTITIELHKPSDLSLKYSKKVVFDIFGNASIVLPEYLVHKNYYIVLRHRNSIETWSSKPVLMLDNVKYDFTSSISQAFGNNLKWIGNVACIFSGDINQDGQINMLDFYLWDHDNSNFIFGYYLNTDLNGDLITDLSDFPFWDDNFTLRIGVIRPYAMPGFQDEEEVLNIYPNPVNQLVELQLTNIAEGANAEMFSSTGALIKSFQLNREKRNYIDVSKYASGVYLLKLSNNGQVINKKILIEH